MSPRKRRGGRKAASTQGPNKKSKLNKESEAEEENLEETQEEAPQQNQDTELTYTIEATIQQENQDQEHSEGQDLILETLPPLVSQAFAEASKSVAERTKKDQNNRMFNKIFEENEERSVQEVVRTIKRDVEDSSESAEEQENLQAGGETIFYLNVNAEEFNQIRLEGKIIAPGIDIDPNEIYECNAKEASTATETDECNFRFKTKFGRRRHIRVDHQDLYQNLYPESCATDPADEKGEFKCMFQLIDDDPESVCGFRCASEVAQMFHQINHTVEDPVLQIHETDEIEDLGLIDYEEMEHNFINEQYFLERESQRTKKFTDDDDEEEDPPGPIVYQCPFQDCTAVFKRYALKTHLYEHTNETPVKCNLCDKEYTSAHLLKTHISICHDISILRQINVCELCGHQYASRKSLAKHMATHDDARAKTCFCDAANCGAAFYDKETLKSHRMRAHYPKTARKYKCDTSGCFYTCLYAHQLVEHKRVHSTDKPYQCDKCEYSAKSKWTFKKHYRRHTQERPFRCPHCPYASALSSNLTRHLRTHTGAKPYQCPWCDYSCNNHENLRKHVLNTKKHRGKSLYNCSLCKYSTNVHADYKTHLLRRHTDIYSPDQIETLTSLVYNKSMDVPREAALSTSPVVILAQGPNGVDETLTLSQAQTDAIVKSARARNPLARKTQAGRAQQGQDKALDDALQGGSYTIQGHDGQEYTIDAETAQQIIVMNEENDSQEMEGGEGEAEDQEAQYHEAMLDADGHILLKDANGNIYVASDQVVSVDQTQNAGVEAELVSQEG